MLNITQMISEAVEKVNQLKKEFLDGIEKGYATRMSKVADVEKQIADIPKTCAGKSQVFIQKKRAQLTAKLEKLRQSADEWVETQKKELEEKMKKMLEDKKAAAQKAYEDELEQIKGAEELAAKMSS